MEPPPSYKTLTSDPTSCLGATVFPQTTAVSRAFKRRRPPHPCLRAENKDPIQEANREANWNLNVYDGIL